MKKSSTFSPFAKGIAQPRKSLSEEFTVIEDSQNTLDVQPEENINVVDDTSNIYQLNSVEKLATQNNITSVVIEDTELKLNQLVDLLSNELTFDQSIFAKLSNAVAEQLAEKIINSKFTVVEVSSDIPAINNIRNAVKPIIENELKNYIRGILVNGT